MKDVRLHFEGPFTLTSGNHSLFHAPSGNLGGIYLWTFKQEATGQHLIHYVGETTSFARRHRDHLVQVLSLNYGLFDPDHAKQGKCTMIWPGLWRDRSPAGPSRLIEAYARLSSLVPKYLAGLSVFSAVLDAETSLRRHIEGAIGWNLRRNHPERKILYPDDNRVGVGKQPRNVRLLISSSEPILGLDSEMVL